MSWILNDDDRVLYAEAKGLGADDIIVQSKASVEKFIQTKLLLQTQSTAGKSITKSHSMLLNKT
jgi:hypothetical protein